jgi:hypothetical protein
MTSGTILARGWAVLAPPRDSELASYPIDITFAGIAVRIALDRAGFRHLLVPAAGESLPLDVRPSTLTVAVRKLEFGADDSIYVDLSCTELDLHAEFDEVLTEVLESIRGVEKPGTVAMQSIARWRRLFRSRLVRGLDSQAKVGLFAELCVLSALLDGDRDFSVDRWRGPLREPHDFETANSCLEVKGRGADSDAVVIHGLEQLQAHSARPLNLILMTVVPDPEGASIGDVVERLLPRVNSRADLRALLDAAGFHLKSDIPDTETFTVDSVMSVRVDDSVPRIVPSSLRMGVVPAGVTDVTYRIDFDALLPHATSASLDEIARDALR